MVVVPGFFAADGSAATSGKAEGDVWRVHFVPDSAGKWTYTPSFRKGSDIAVSLDPDAGRSVAFDGKGDCFYDAD